MLIDARPLQGRSAKRGIGSYVRGLLEGFAEAPPKQTLALLVDAKLPRPDVDARFTLVEVRRRYRGRLAAYEDAAVLGGDLDRIRPAAFHATTLSLPSRSPCPVLVTLHDLIPWAWGGPWMIGERFRHYPGKRLLRRAEHVIAVSEASAADGIHHGGIARDRIEVIPEAAGAAFREAVGAAARVESRWGLTRPFLLYSGALDRRKDPVGLVRAWRAVKRTGFDADLVITGDPGAQAPGRMGGARLLGYVTDEELADLYRAAACFVYPSRYEGFGLPLLEAMSCGCPVVAYDNSSIPELVDGFGGLVRDGDALALGRKAAELGQDGEARKEAVTAGLRKASGYSWARTARATARAYDRVCAMVRAR